MNVGEICNREVVITTGTTPLLEVAQLMRQHHVGSVIVVNPQGPKNVPVGIITDRDIVLEIVAPSLNIDEFCAGDVMSGNIEKAYVNQELWETIHLMREKGVRRIVIVDNDDYLVGLLSVDDILESLVEEFGEVVNLIAKEQKREIITRTVP